MRASDCPTVDTTEFLLAALEQASEAVVIIDSDLHVSHFNAAAESIWGVAREDILGLEASCLGLTDLRPNSEITIRRADGSRLRASVSASRVEIGGRSSYMVFVRDITAEVERRERIALLNLVADKTTRAVVVTDRNLRVVYTNAAFSGMFGYSAEEAQGRQANQLLAGPLTDRKTAAPAAPPDLRRTAATRRKFSPTTRTATRSGSRPRSRRSATIAGASNTYSPC